MKKKGFTLIELLVVIAIIAMLLAILMPALGKVKQLAMRLVCGTNLKGMGTAVNVYAFDYDDSYPEAGGRGDNLWATVGTGTNPKSSTTLNWDLPNYDWLGVDNVSVSASLFMLVREADVGTKSFVCKSSDQQAFVNELTTDVDLVELWDFGGLTDPADQTPAKCQSYSYQFPYGSFSVDGTSPASAAVMADRNPWFDEKLDRGTPADSSDMGKVDLIDWTDGAAKYKVQAGNAEAHGREGQNVLFNDGHVEFSKRPDIATQNDNIYTAQDITANADNNRRMGVKQFDVGPTAYVTNGDDTFLVSDSEK